MNRRIINSQSTLNLSILNLRKLRKKREENAWKIPAFHNVLLQCGYNKVTKGDYDRSSDLQITENGLLRLCTVKRFCHWKKRGQALRLHSHLCDFVMRLWTSHEKSHPIGIHSNWCDLKKRYLNYFGVAFDATLIHKATSYQNCIKSRIKFMKIVWLCRCTVNGASNFHISYFFVSDWQYWSVKLLIIIMSI